MKNYFTVKTLYFKYPLDNDWSVRFHLIFKGSNKYQYKWILKSHSTKEYLILKKEEAEKYIEKYDTKPKLILGFLFGDIFKKVEISSLGELEYFTDME
jgi:hypothetical protein